MTTKSEVKDVKSLRVIVNQVASQLHSNENSYTVGNSLIQDIRRKSLYNSNGETMPVNVERLFCEASRKTNNSATLAYNICVATGTAKPKGHHSHHIVAQRAKAATESRTILFKAGIGINDYRNGFNLSRQEHEGLHTLVYYGKVTYLLTLVQEDGTEKVGQTLMAISNSIKQGTFV
jgi:hypothetical protein